MWYEHELSGLLILGMVNAAVAVTFAFHIARTMLRQRAAERLLRLRIAMRWQGKQES
jgi:uncharacterized membrane protein YdjX (TVP38/TMEM64 family)